MHDLNQANVLLSASFPSGERGERFKPYDPSGIADAVTAFARAVLANNGRLTFGGHPTITPIVLMISRELRIAGSITVFQSAWFKEALQLPEVDEIKKEDLACVEWTRCVDDRDESLQIMRSAMIQQGQYASALFIGGMEGIETEYSMVKRFSPTTPCVPIMGPGGMAARLSTTDYEKLGMTEFLRSRAYPYMALHFVKALSGTAISQN
ncbi:MAG: hypothetical protein OXG25_10150 [Gammaproteobacteria bacterium]|nr:hypothetical protein [Gammaproteobacteria bacterium]